MASKSASRPIPTISFCYLRHWVDSGMHRFGAISLRKRITGDYDMSFYVHNPKHGAFSPGRAKTAIVGRLNSPRMSQVVTKEDITGGAVPFMEKIGVLRRYHNSYGVRYDRLEGIVNVKNCSALRGAMVELDPRPKKKKTRKMQKSAARK